MYSKKVIDQINESFETEKATKLLDESKYYILTESEFLDNAFGGFEFGADVDYLGIMEYLDVSDLQHFKLYHNFETLFYKFLESDQGIYYDYNKSKTLFSNNIMDLNLYILKLNEKNK